MSAEAETVPTTETVEEIKEQQKDAAKEQVEEKKEDNGTEATEEPKADEPAKDAEEKSEDKKEETEEKAENGHEKKSEEPEQKAGEKRKADEAKDEGEPAEKKAELDLRFFQFLTRLLTRHFRFVHAKLFRRTTTRIFPYWTVSLTGHSIFLVNFKVTVQSLLFYQIFALEI